ncbi:MAG TPA: hypothetical protein VIM33_07695 [Gaiellaceae bacterium]|jgi:hypothetical protein
MTDVRALLQRTADLASDFLESLDDRPIFPTASAAQLVKPWVERSPRARPTLRTS